jgi:hypothetical protein
MPSPISNLKWIIMWNTELKARTGIRFAKLSDTVHEIIEIPGLLALQYKA